jgi:hypothetical protein
MVTGTMFSCADNSTLLVLSRAPSGSKTMPRAASEQAYLSILLRKRFSEAPS